MYNEENTVNQYIINNTAIATCNASVKNGMMIGYQRITNQFNDKVVNDYVVSSYLDLHFRYYKA